MPVVANLSVLLAARVENYTSGIGLARKSNDEFKESAKAAGLSTRSAAQALGILRKQAFDSLSTMEKQQEELRALNHLYEAGIVTQKDYNAAQQRINAAYDQVKIKEQTQAQEALNAAQQRGLALVRPQLENQQKLRAEYAATLESLKSLQGSETARQLGITDAQINNTRKNVTRDFLANLKGKEAPTETFQKSAAAVDKFNSSLLTARQRANAQVAELRKLKEQAAATNRELDSGRVGTRLREILDQFRRESGLDTKLAEEKKVRERAEIDLQRAIERGLPLLDREFAAKQKLLAAQRDLRAAATANPNLDYESAVTRLRDDFFSQQSGRESQEQRKQRILKENETAEAKALNAFAQRAKSYEELNQDIIAGLNERAAATRRAQIQQVYTEQIKTQRAPIEAIDAQIIEAQNRYNEAVKRGVSAANPAADATDRYRASLKDLNKALFQAKIDQEQYNRAKLAATRAREDASIDPILRAGRDIAAPYEQIATNIVRNVENMREAVKAGVIDQQQMAQAAKVNQNANIRLAQTYRVLRRQLANNKISMDEFRIATRLAKSEIIGQNTVINRLTNSLGVLKTVGIGLAGAQIYGAIFGGLNDGFAFEKQIRLAIANFREADRETQEALRSAVVSTTSNNDTQILERVAVLKEIARDGIAAGTALQSYNDTLAFAAVTGLDASAAVSRVSEVMKAYRLETNEAAQDSESLRQIMDLLQASSLQTASDVEEMAEALIRSAPQANQLGISLRSAAAGAIALSEIGRKGDVGGNELAIALRDITNKANENEEAFKNLGVEVFDTEGDFVGMSITIRSLAQALEGLSAQERVNAIAQLGVTQKAAQFQQQLVSLVDVIEQAETSFGDTNGAVVEIQDTLPELNKLVNKLQSGFTYLINTTVYQFFETIAGAINNSSSEMRTFVVVIAASVAGWAAYNALAPTVVAWIARTAVALTGLTAAQNANNTATVFGLALSKNWKQLAASILVAAAAGTAMYYVWDQLEAGFGLAGLVDVTDEMTRLRDAIDAGRTDIDGLQRQFADSTAKIKSSVSSQVESLESADPKQGYLGKLLTLVDGIDKAIESADVERIGDATQEMERLAGSINSFANIDSENAGQLAEQYKTVEYRVQRVVEALKRGKDALDNLGNSRGFSDATDEALNRARQVRQELDQAANQFKQNSELQSGQLGNLLNTLGEQVSNANRNQFRAAEGELKALQGLVADALKQSPQQNALLGTFDSVIDKIQEVYKELGRADLSDFVDKQAQAVQDIQKELESPLDRAIAKLQRLDVLQIELEPRIRTEYLEKVLSELDAANNNTPDQLKINQEAVVRGTVQEYVARNAAFSNDQANEQRQRHRELIRSISAGNSKLDTVVQELRNQNNQTTQDPVDPFDF